jgi:hypothetical protein
MTLDLKGIMGVAKNEAPAVKGSEPGLGEWLGGAMKDLHKSSSAGLVQGTAERMKAGENPIQAFWGTAQDNRAATVRTGLRAAYVVGQVKTGGKLDQFGGDKLLQGAGKHLGAESDGQEFHLAPKEVKTLVGGAAGNPGGFTAGLKEQGASMLGGKPGGGFMDAQNVKGFTAMLQTRQELGNSGPANNGPKIEMPGFKMPALPGK